MGVDGVGASLNDYATNNAGDNGHQSRTQNKPDGDFL